MEQLNETGSNATEEKTMGVGDWIEEKITKPSGIKKTVEAISSSLGIKDCGCNKRKEALNNLPFKFKK